MPNTPFFTGQSPAKTERRRFQREQPRALVYLDIGTDNGGIVTDLTEDGAGVQAVGPLDRLSSVTVRFQIPDSQIQIKTAVQITWVSESRRHAGLQFLDFAEEDRAKIRDWLSLQAASSSESLTQTEMTAPPQRVQATENPRKEKWINLVAGTEVTAKKSAPPKPEAVQSNTHRDGLSKAETAADSKPTTEIPLHGFLRELALAKQSRALRAVPRREVPDISSSALPATPPTADPQAAQPEVHKAGRDSVIELPVSTPAADRAIEPAPATAALVPSPQPLVPDAGRTKTLLDSAVSPRPNISVANRGVSSWKWATIGIVGVVLSVASFGVGRWLGGARGVLNTPATSPIPVQKAPVAAVATPQKRSDANGATPDRRERRADNVRRKSISQEVGSVPPRRELTPPPAPQTSQPAPQLASPTPPRETLSIAVPAQVTTAPAPPADKEAHSASTPIIVNGRVLGPLDRFNAAHLTYRFDPDYPAAAKERRIEGTVDLHLMIGANGSVENVKPVSGPPIFFDAAVAAVKNWRFLPALLNGQPVETEQDVKVDFRLPRSSGK